MRPHPRYAETDAASPRAWATCENCGFVWNLYKLKWGREWRGMRVENTRHLVCPICNDVPQRQLGALILPPDPVGVRDARPEQYTADEQRIRVEEDGSIRYQMDGQPRIQSNLQSGSPASGP